MTSVMKRIVIDIDNTLCFTKNNDYINSIPYIDVIMKLKQYKKEGFYIILFTSRNMNSYQNNIGKITANTLPIIFQWLQKYEVPYDELVIGKPWCGKQGFYVDDKAIRPYEFLTMDYNKICNLLEIKNDHN